MNNSNLAGGDSSFNSSKKLRKSLNFFNSGRGSSTPKNSSMNENRSVRKFSFRFRKWLRSKESKEANDICVERNANDFTPQLGSISEDKLEIESSLSVTNDESSMMSEKSKIKSESEADIYNFSCLKTPSLNAVNDSTDVKITKEIEIQTTESFLNQNKSMGKLLESKNILISSLKSDLEWKENDFKTTLSKIQELTENCKSLAFDISKLEERNKKETTNNHLENAVYRIRLEAEEKENENLRLNLDHLNKCLNAISIENHHNSQIFLREKESDADKLAACYDKLRILTSYLNMTNNQLNTKINEGNLSAMLLNFKGTMEEELLKKQKLEERAKSLLLSISKASKEIQKFRNN